MHDGQCMMVNAWSCEQEVVVGQEAVPATTNETKTLPPLLHLLELEGAIVTIDAAGCYAEVAEEILRAGADYVITLKANQKHLYPEASISRSIYIQKHLYREAKALFDQLEAIGRLPEPHTSVDGGHDRVEVRRCWALAVNNTELNRESDRESNTEGWPGLSTICRIQSERHHPDGSPDGSIETEERLFISSLEAAPDQLLKAVRRHWHVENKLHWSLDVAFGEDESRVRTGHAAQNLGVVRRLALSLLKQETSRSQGIATVPDKKERAGCAMV
jgi:predicted transposase YbfD/YdcC